MTKICNELCLEDIINNNGVHGLNDNLINLIINILPMQDGSK